MNVKKLICSIGFILLMATFTNAKLVGYWQMDESSGKTANDRLGDKPATLIGDAKFEPDSGKFGGAVRFGPKGDLVKILGYKGICGKSPRTVSAWVKAESPGTIFSWGNPMIKGGLWEILAKLMVNDGTSDAIVLHLSVMPGIIQGTTPLIDGKWHHIAVVLKESQSPHLSDIVLYVDGKEEIIDVMRNYSIDTKEERFVWIGYELKGLVDEVAIFDNSLNQAEITQLYKQRALSFIGPESQKVVEVISKAKALMEKQEYGRAVKLLQINIVELRQKSISKPNKKNVLLSQLSNLYFQLAIAKEAAGLAESEYVEDYKKAVLSASYGSKALAWLIEKLPADKFQLAIKETCNDVNNIETISAKFAKFSGEHPKIEAFKLFVDAVTDEKEDALSCARAIEKGLGRNLFWKKIYLDHCRLKPNLFEYVVEQDCGQAGKCEAEGNYEAALKIYNELIGKCDSEKTKNPRLILKKIECIFNCGQYKNAAEELGEFITEYKSSKRQLCQDALILKGKCFVQAGEIDSALKDFLAFVTEYPLSPQSPQAAYFVGYCHMLKGNYDLATQAFKLVISDYPQSSYAGKARLSMDRIKSMVE